MCIVLVLNAFHYLCGTIKGILSDARRKKKFPLQKDVHIKWLYWVFLVNNLKSIIYIIHKLGIKGTGQASFLRRLYFSFLLTNRNRAAFYAIVILNVCMIQSEVFIS